MNTNQTPFTEANALLALLRDEYDEAREILADSSEEELFRIFEAAQRLASLAVAMAGRKHNEGVDREG